MYVVPREKKLTLSCITADDLQVTRACGPTAYALMF